MNGNGRSRVLSICSLGTALLLVMAGLFEFQRDAVGMALFSLILMVCALIIAWHGQKPLQGGNRKTYPEPKNL